MNRARASLGSSALGSAVLAWITPGAFGQGMFAAFALVGAFLFFRAGWRTAREPARRDGDPGASK